MIEYTQPRGKKIDLAIPNPGTAHICFEVTDIQAAYENLTSKGIDFLSKPVQLAPNPDSGAKGGYIAYFTDPDGFSLELYQTLG